MSEIDTKAIERAVMADQNMPCLYNVAPPCMHPKCLEAHFKTLFAEAQARRSTSDAAGDASK